MADFAFDNDVLIKGAAYGLLDAVAHSYSSTVSNVAVLSAARFVCRNAIAKRASPANVAAANARLEAFLDAASVLDPTDQELALAIDLEERAAKSVGGLDSGESQLVAILIMRSMSGLVTGDKRAIAALAQLLNSGPHSSAVAGRLVCMEQAVLRVATAVGCSVLKGQICSEPNIDKALSNCFSCANPAQTTCDCEPGLKSYIASAYTKGAPAMSNYGT